MPEKRKVHPDNSVPATNAWRTLAALFALAFTGCASQPATSVDAGEFQREQMRESALDELNALIARQSNPAVPESTPDSYRLGPGDLLQVQIFGVPDLDREVRVDGRGRVTLPLVGEVSVGGLTVREMEERVAARYGGSYLREPQINVLVTEYRARRITVLGAVKEPKIYSVQRHVHVVEALAMAGGLTAEAGGSVYVTDRVTDPDIGQPMRRNLIIHLDRLLEGRSVADGEENRLDVALGEDAVVNVPTAGVVFVEGAVEKPGAYIMQGETTVLKAVAMAGGLRFEARESAIKVLRVGLDGQASPVDSVDIDHVRAHPQDDVGLQDGDVVVVETSKFQAALSAVVRGARGLFGFGYTLNR